MSSPTPSRKTRPGARPRAADGAAIALQHRNLPLLLLQARESVLSRFRPVLQAHGLTEQQWRIVRALHERGSMEPREIVEACCISSPSLAGVLQRMDQMGLVARERHDSDQRRVIVSLTPQGRQRVARMAPLIEATYRHMEAQLGDTAVKRLYAQLDVLLKSLADAGESTRPRAGEDAGPPQSPSNTAETARPQDPGLDTAPSRRRSTQAGRAAPAREPR